MKDTGIGIGEDEVNKLFQEFGKLKDNNKLNESGCGLGLTICKKISQSMKGMIAVESKVGVGSIFTFYFKYYKPIGDIPEIQTLFFENEESLIVFKFNLKLYRLIEWT